MNIDEYERKCFIINESYNGKDIGEENGAESLIFWQPEKDGYRLDAEVNNNFNFRYFRFIRSEAEDKQGIVCRIRIDKPKYVFHKGDTILTKLELQWMINLFKSKNKICNKSYWECVIDACWRAYLWYGGDQEKSNIYLPMPNYSLLPTSD